MSHCVIAYNGYLMLAPQGFDCTYVMLTPSELDDIKNVSFGSLTIDSQLYSDLTAYLLLSFFGGHVLGRLVKTMGRR
ncbi:Uncharacterised protein [Vibrio cholerae]|uniref:Uncharacterized protein n=5 Tax=Vibrio TaxID=662 RepID=A0A5C9HPU7_VIBCL|nr:MULTISPECIES: hypothetical protein [Vibrio]EAZ74154.1 hypothetical protein A5C_1487 [Vibrio cholerae NCTC 8457]APF82915.1 hypothetical protein ASZ86_01491 [Vibrio cholerae]EGQ7690418.1 hypothetical protein [Vibrio cholerae]EGQ7881746.1 hypothetical protein [Vibrio cholerae]EGQ7944689.1 hypothetical protein [Vibrio cholerae]